MTKSKGLGRGGARKGAGRRPNVAKIDWDAVGRAYFVGTEPVEEICDSFGVSYGDLLAYAAHNHWIHRPAKRHPEDVGDLASALALAMWEVDGVMKRARGFVAAMVALETPIEHIAEVLHVSPEALRADFAKELVGARG